MIELHEVYKSYMRGTTREVRALNGIDLTCSDGEWVVAIGSNGAGKSSLLRVTAGATRPDRGAVRIGGRTVTRLPEYKRARLIGRIDQDPMASTAPALSVEENLAIAWARRRVRGFAPAVTRRRRLMYSDLLADLGMGLERRLKSNVATLSGGQRQALGLVMATMGDPAVLLLDEHIAALDPKVAASVMSLTERLIRGNHLTALMVTHNMSHAIRWGDRLLMMHEGRIILDVRDEEKRALTVEELTNRFHQISHAVFDDDRSLLADP